MAHQWLTGWWNQGPRGNRRQRQRIERYFDCSWMSVWGDQKARISSISPTGCYIDSRFTVPPEGTHVREICMTIPGGELSVHGTVLCPTPGVGFAVRFADMDDETQAALNRLVFARA
jgi:hypothetical protein